MKIDCESLPCPCLKPGEAGGGGKDEPSTKPAEPSCSRPNEVQSISFSATKSPRIKRHAERAIAKGWPSVLVLNRPGADARRDRLLSSWSTRAGYDRNEYPPAVGRAAVRV